MNNAIIDFKAGGLVKIGVGGGISARVKNEET
jgi:hypothetical protein